MGNPTCPDGNPEFDGRANVVCTCGHDGYKHSMIFGGSCPCWERDCECKHFVERVPREVSPPPPRDWPAFWQSLTDAEAAACLRAAPDIAGQWTEGERPARWTRWSIVNGVRVGLVVKKRTGWYVYHPRLGDEHPADGFRFFSEARSACDAALRAAGWRVL